MFLGLSKLSCFQICQILRALKPSRSFIILDVFQIFHLRRSSRSCSYNDELKQINYFSYDFSAYSQVINAIGSFQSFSNSSACLFQSLLVLYVLCSRSFMIWSFPDVPCFEVFQIFIFLGNPHLSWFANLQIFNVWVIIDLTCSEVFKIVCICRYELSPYSFPSVYPICAITVDSTRKSIYPLTNLVSNHVRCLVTFLTIKASCRSRLSCRRWPSS